jgi:hypothetical protein
MVPFPLFITNSRNCRKHLTVGTQVYKPEMKIASRPPLALSIIKNPPKKLFGGFFMIGYSKVTFESR